MFERSNPFRSPLLRQWWEREQDEMEAFLAGFMGYTAGVRHHLGERCPEGYYVIEWLDDPEPSSRLFAWPASSAIPEGAVIVGQELNGSPYASLEMAELVIGVLEGDEEATAEWQYRQPRKGWCVAW